MKKSLALFALLLMGTVGVTNNVKAQDNSEAITACIVDGFGYVWSLDHVTKSGGVYTGTGTVDLSVGFLWNGTVTYNTHTGATTFRADNPQADGCQSGYTDYFTYSGTAIASYHNHTVDYSGSGTWASFCSGSQINSGTWSATDCAGKRGTIDPNGPALSAAKSSNSQAKAPPAITACIVDAFGYVWSLDHVTKSGGVYTGTGTVDLSVGFLWDGTVTYNTHTGATTFRADNPQADGCQSGYTDYFTYSGTATASYHNHTVDYSGSGTWASFCSGSQINSGTWSATDCAGKGTKTLKGTGNPAKSAGLPPLTTACISDAFGYTWNLTSITKENHVRTGTGTIDVGAGFLWDATVTYDASTGWTTLRADNPQADGCQSGFTDYFEYTGTATASVDANSLTYSGSGTWNSYCSGTVINSGTWSATNCPSKPRNINPNGPAKHAGISLLKVSPNPISNSANISYAVAQSGKVNITVYNSMQQAVKVLVNDFKNAGNYSAVWDTRSSNVIAGVYRVVAVVNGKTYTTTVQVVR